MEITVKYHKTNTISNWKRNGVIYHDFDDLYEIYIKTMECGHCKKEFKNTKDRHLDHCHETGHFRKIVCNMCNNYDNYLRFPDGIPSKSERDKKCRDKNKDKYYAKAREKYTCECGCIIGRGKKARHKKTMKHAQLMEQLN